MLISKCVVWAIFKGLLKGIVFIAFSVYMSTCLSMYNSTIDDHGFTMMLFVPGLAMIVLAPVALVIFVTHASWLYFKEEESKNDKK